VAWRLAIDSGPLRAWSPRPTSASTPPCATAGCSARRASTATSRSDPRPARRPR
jgi:hypothetical protein